MATKEPKKPHKLKPKPSCFPSCFGVAAVFDHDEKKSHYCSRHGRKRSPWFSNWFSFQMRKSRSKTVPLDARALDKITSATTAIAATSVAADKVPAKSVEKLSHRRNQVAVSSAAEEGALNNSPKIKSGGDKIQRGESKTLISPIRLHNPPDPAMPSLSNICSKIGRRRSVSGSRSSDKNLSRSLTTSSTFPPPTHLRSMQSVGMSQFSTPKNDLENVAVPREIDPLIGMLILIVTLAILLACGRLCAVICTATWFFFIPKLRMAMNASKSSENSSGSESTEVKYSSSEYKKKVILEGLLERNHRIMPAVAL